MGAESMLDASVDLAPTVAFGAALVVATLHDAGGWSFGAVGRGLLEATGGIGSSSSKAIQAGCCSVGCDGKGLSAVDRDADGDGWPEGESDGCAGFFIALVRFAAVACCVEEGTALVRVVVTEGTGASSSSSSSSPKSTSFDGPMSPSVDSSEQLSRSSMLNGFAPNPRSSLALVAAVDFDG